MPDCTDCSHFRFEPVLSDHTPSSRGWVPWEGNKRQERSSGQEGFAHSTAVVGGQLTARISSNNQREISRCLLCILSLLVPASLLTLPPESSVQMTNSSRLSIWCRLLSTPAGGLTPNVFWVVWGGGTERDRERERNHIPEIFLLYY